MTGRVVQAIEVGRRRADSALFLYLTDFGVEIEIAYRLWLIRDGSGTIVVDTGPPLDEAHRRGITQVRDIDHALAEADVRAADVRTVVLTHLHWDHAANAAKFPNAVFLAQRREIDFFHSHAREHATLNRFFSHQAFLGTLIAEGRIRPIDDDTIAPGIEAIRVGGHTPGSQMLVVATDEGRAVISGDAIPLHRNYLDNIPSGIVVDTIEAIGALDRVRALRPAAIYTGHDLSPCLRPS